ncbi:Capsular polysaccharide synthesis protein [Brevibacterium sandarakinum]|uniref:Capsular polysaccharide synthesis protein n=1 Tax=Brevibacterium sandarakinum TaxID=629680 RepID=A0A1H1PQU2_BRESA|nr:capsular polysaccharide synthesis protein [Brevibacterium sandarakinum]SDS13642.1 Capsular polysaccharide synthesis protein [Brevibacterium sandarakinum]
METIWLYWENVYSASMPDYIQLCMETIEAQAGDWDVVLLTPENVREHISGLRDDFFDIPEVAHKADYIRGAVLEQCGGLWMDIDTIALRPLSLITDLLPLHGAVFYGWQSFQPSIGLIASEPGHPLIAQWKARMDVALDSGLSQKWSGIGYDLLWPLAKTIPYTHIAHTICAPTHYTETAKFVENLEPDEVLKAETVVMQLYNKMFFKIYGSMGRDEILGSDSLIAKCFAIGLQADPKWQILAKQLTHDSSLRVKSRDRAANGEGNIGTIYVNEALEMYETS